MTVQDIITSALRLLGVVQAGETPATEDLNDGLQVWNMLLDNWNAVHLTIYTIVNETLPLTPGTAKYTMGPGGDLNAPRPVKIESAGIIQSNGLRTDLEIISSKRYAAIPEKAAQAQQPLLLYNDNDWPEVNLSLWPAPVGAPTLDLYVWEQLTEPMVLTDPIQLPPAFLKSLRYNLAVDLASEYGRDPGQVVASIAQQTKQELFALNASNDLAMEDPPPPPAPPAAPAQQ